MIDPALKRTDHTYFVMTPGVDLNSYITYGNGWTGVYIKFGDQSGTPGKVGIRDAYRVHNPDIGIAMIVRDALPGEALGTRLKQLVASLGWQPIGDGGRTEWFVVPSRRGHNLFRRMVENWDVPEGSPEKTVDNWNVTYLERDIEDALGRPNAEEMGAPVELTRAELSP